MLRVSRIAALIGMGNPLGRGLVRFWQSLAIAGVVLAGVLQVLGPPPSGVRDMALVVAPTGPTEASLAVTGPPPPPVVRQVVVRPTPAPIAVLQEPAAGLAGATLPRIGPDGRAPRDAYAVPFDRTDSRPRIGLIMLGLGLNGADTEEAIRSLAAGSTVAFSPYAQRFDPHVAAARARGHELLMSLPLEPRDAPMNDAGNQSLLVSAPVEQNLRRLEWSLSRFPGYVGAIGALGALRGERFSVSGEPMRLMMQTLAARGLLYIDPRAGSGATPLVWGRAIDVIIDQTPQRSDIELSLQKLEQMARERGSVLAMASAPLPVTVGRIAVWAAGLAERGLVLAPVSVLVNEPDTAPPPVQPIPPYQPSESRLDRQERVR